MSIFKNSRVYVLATVAYTGSFLFGKTKALLAIKYRMLRCSKDMTQV